jgi:hypothetical protein
MKTAKTSRSKAPIMTIYGNEGRGKTTLAAKLFPSAAWFLLEKGLPTGISVDAIEGTDSFEGVMAPLREIYAADTCEHGALVFDTADTLEAHLIEWVCAKNGWDSIEKPAYGKGWIMCDDVWRRFLRAIAAVRDKHNIAICLTCHATVERIDDPRAPTYTSYQPKLHKRARALVMDACDLVGFLAEDLRVITDDSGFRERTRASSGNARHLFVEGTPAFAAKNRFGMPAKVPIPLNLDIATLTQYWRSDD